MENLTQNIKRKSLIDLYKFLDKYKLSYLVDSEQVAISHDSSYIRFNKETLLVVWDSDIILKGDTIEKFIKIYPKYIKLKNNIDKLKNNS